MSYPGVTSKAASDDMTLSDSARAELVGGCARHAVASLQRATAAGLFKDKAKVAWVKNNQDLDCLQSRAEFRKWFSEAFR
jgi:hypothetical protein